MTDPTRLRDGGGSAELRRLVMRAEEDLLDDAGYARLRAKLAARGISEGETPSASTTARPWWAAKAGVGVLLFAAAAALGATYHAMSRRAGAPIQPPIVEVAPPVAAPVASPAARASASSVVPSAEGANASAIVSSTPSAPRQLGLPMGARHTAEAPSASSQAPAPSPREGLLLMQARQALEQDPARALALVEAHERQFPQSPLAPERATLKREALARIPR